MTIKILIQASNVRNFSNGLIPTFPDIKEIEGLRCISKFMMGRSSALGSLGKTTSFLKGRDEM